ncbi:MAG: hypothetical protein RIS47_2243 [Bacteroidota bacterium]|jgi:hypothetical protein
MMRVVLRNAFRLIALVLFQIILNLIHFSSLELSPYFYLIFILLLPFETPQWLVLLSSFFLGLLVDWHADSFGQHAFASVFVAGIRPMVLTSLSDRDSYEKGTYPRLEYFGLIWALKYALLMTFAHQFIFYWIEAFSLKQMGWVLAKAVVNTLITTFLIIVSQYWVFKKVV